MNCVVEIIISTTQQLILVPDILQLSLEQATSILNSDNVDYEISYIDTDYSVQEGVVLGQNPDAGTYISVDSIIILFVGQ